MKSLFAFIAGSALNSAITAAGVGSSGGVLIHMLAFAFFGGAWLWCQTMEPKGTEQQQEKK